MDAPKPKPNLPNYTQALIYIGGTAIVATVIVGGVIYNNAQQDKVQQNTNTTTAVTTEATVPATTSAEPVEQVSPYDGTYSGKTQVAHGISEATVYVTNNKVSGGGTYVDGDIKIGISINGSVDENGNAKGNFSGSTEIEGVKITGGGSYEGKITGKTAVVSYKASGAGRSYSGSITLTKK